ncbi:MAG: hypothetical protein HYX60_02985 [Legionella longbeachae]|nr:hypothetical protein [Legionella longbeachae]
MMNSRRKIIAQIAMLDRTLQYQKQQVIEHKKYFAQHKINPLQITTIALLIIAFVIGFKAGRKLWTSRLMQQTLEVGTIVFLNYFKKSFVALFK